MKTLILLITAIVFSSNVYAKPKEMDREKYYYYCSEHRLPVDKKGNTKCKNLKKGDVLAGIDQIEALMYCDTEFPVMSEPSSSGVYILYYCLYNGRPIKKSKELK